VSTSADRLRARRTVLLLRAEAERLEMREHARRIGAAADSGDRGLGLARKVATPPVLVGAAAALVFLLGRGRTRQAIAAGLTVLGLVLRVRSAGQALAGLAGDQAVRRSR
jgi:hypothetical protein